VDSQKHQFQIHLPGLLEVLAESLYSNDSVAVRELLQNAHDSCVRRLVESQDTKFRPRVDVSVDAQNQTLTIRDNGSGLTADEIQDYLSTIGRSYTRQLGEDLAILSPEEAEKLIGQFGLGFLSAFLIASQITLTTRSFREGSDTLRWQSSGDAHYEVTTVERGAVGTSIELKLKTTALPLTSRDVLINTVRRYADFLSVPIYVEASRQPVNLMMPPWEAADTEASIRDYIAEKFEVQNPLTILELKDHFVNIGHDSIKVPLSGFLFVPPGTIASIQEFGDLTIYIRRMFICDGPSELLPSWARFIRGVIDCPHLQPTASREQVQMNESFDLVKQALREQLAAGLKRIAQEQPAMWRLIVRAHRDVIIGWAVRDDEFFNDIADIVTFRTSRGALTLPEYLKLTNGILYYSTREIGSLQDQILSEGSSRPVIDASIFAEPAFLMKYAEQKTGVQARKIDDNPDELFEPALEAEFVALQSALQNKGIQARVVRFAPENLPAVIVYPQRAAFIEEARDSLETGELPEPFAGLIESYISKTGADESLSGILYLNANNAIIQRLARTDDAVLRETGFTLIYQIARLLSGRLLNVRKAKDLFQSLTEGFVNLLDKP